MNENVATLLQGYFHEDWSDDASDPMQVIDHFIGTSGLTSVEINRLAICLMQLARQHDTDAGGWLFRDLGCYYDPSADGLTDAEWLRNAAQRLIAGST